MRKLWLCIMVVILFSVAMLHIGAYADIMPMSSVTFSRAVVSASETGGVTFSATLNKKCSTVSVSSCTLQKQEEGRWVFAASLETPPSKSNISKYTAHKDYSSNMTTGVNYRIVATFNADGETMTKTSNSFTY